MQPLLETMPLISANRKRAEEAFGVGRFHQIEHETAGPLGNCYWNVDQFVSQNGGAMAIGWQILQWPKLFIVAIHHAVWKARDARLIDLTEKYRTDKRPYSTFAIDDSIQISLHSPILIENRYLVLSQAPEVRKYIELDRTQLAIRRRLLTVAIEQGAVWEPGKGLGMRPDLADRLRPDLDMFATSRKEMGDAIKACATLR